MSIFGVLLNKKNIKLFWLRKSYSINVGFIF
jgi:hypothetical protein